MKEKIDVFEQMASRWPSSVVAREEVGTFTGGVLTSRYIANMDSAGDGPEGRLRIGRKIV